MLVLSAILSPGPPNPVVQSPVQLRRQVQESDPVLDEIVRLGPGPVGRWELIEALEPDLGGDRRDLRRRRAEVFRKIDDLVRRGQLVRFGRYRLLPPDSKATTTNTARATDNGYHLVRQTAPRRTAVSRPDNRNVQSGTAHNDDRAPMPTNTEQQATPTNKIIVSCLPAQPPQLKLPKPNPTAEAISEAARSLGKRRGIRKRWSGYVNGERVWRGREIELPDGRRAFAYGALRGQVIWSLDPSCLPGGVDEPLGWGAVPQEKVRLVRNPAAQLLGFQRRGIRERKSEVKAAAVRINGRMPPRPGSRPRGRPSTEGTPSASPIGHQAPHPSPGQERFD